MLKADGTAAPGTVSQTDTDEITFTPDSNMANATVYLFIVSENVRALDDYTKMADNEYVNFTVVA